MRDAIRKLSVCISFIALIPNALTRAEEPFDPQFDAAHLEIDGKTLSPVKVRKPWGPSYHVGSRSIVVRDTMIEDGDSKDGQPAWSVPSTDAQKLHFLGSMGNVALLGRSPLPEGKNNAPELRRFDVAARKWLAPLSVSPEKNDNTHEVMIAVLADEKRVVLLVRQVTGEGREVKPVGSRLVLFKSGEDKPVWSVSFKAESDRPEPGVGLWAPVMPDYATSKLQYLSWLGDAILVCAGEKEELLCVDAATGKVSWRVPRVWEFQRGFIGPSVWSHFIARFGSENLRGELGTPDEEKARAEEEKELKTLRAEFEKQFQCAIIAGPLVMPAAKKANRKLGDPDDARIFLAVAKGPNAWNYGYLSECIAYELSGSGRVLTMANLPRIVRGYQYSTASGGLVWGCEKGAIVRLESAHSQWGGMGPGGPDLLCTIAWYRQFAAPELDGWLTADKVRDVVAFDSARAYRAVAGGYVAKKEEMIYRFPLSVVDLAGGAEATAILVVPYKGTLSLPTQNFSTLALQTHAHGPYLLGVTQLNVEGEQLEVTLGMEKTSVGVTFDLGKLKAPGQK